MIFRVRKERKEYYRTCTILLTSYVIHSSIWWLCCCCYSSADMHCSNYYKIMRDRRKIWYCMFQQFQLSKS